MALTQHPLSAAFPSMSRVDLSALADDIATHGQHLPIVTLGGQVLDGWHRYQACLAVEVPPALEEYDGPDARAYVLAANLQRRHLSTSQRAAAVVACEAWRPLGANQHGGCAAAAHPQLGAAELAEIAEVSTRTIVHAKAAQRAGLGEAVRDGVVSAERAAAAARLPPAQRQAALEAPAPKKQRRVAGVPAAVEAAAEAVPEDDDAGRMADIATEYAALVRIVEADDKVAEAWLEAKTLAAKCGEWERMYDAKCAELAVAQREAKRWMRKAQKAAA